MSVASKGFRYNRTGPIAAVLKLENFQTATVNADKDVVVKVLFSPIHRTDAAVINGTAVGRQSVTQSSISPSCKIAPFPRIGGHEAIGAVVDAGRCKRFKAGDHVWISPTSGVGTWATHVSVNGDHLHAVPQSVEKSAYALASCATGLITGHQMFNRKFANVRPGDVVLVNGGSSLVALAAVATAKQKGATVIAAVSAGDRFAAAKSRLQQAGAAEVVEYTSKGAQAAKAAANGKRVALFANGAGGPSFNDFFRLLGPEGSCVTYGAQNGVGLMWAGSHQIFNGTKHLGFFAPRVLSEMSYDDRQAALVEAWKLSNLKYPVESVKSLDGLGAAWDDMYVNGGKKFVFAF